MPIWFWIEFSIRLQCTFSRNYNKSGWVKGHSKLRITWIMMLIWRLSTIKVWRCINKKLREGEKILKKTSSVMLSIVVKGITLGKWKGRNKKRCFVSKMIIMLSPKWFSKDTVTVGWLKSILKDWIALWERGFGSMMNWIKRIQEWCKGSMTFRVKLMILGADSKVGWSDSLSKSCKKLD